ncbi:MAG: hypothetical protein A2W27_11785 [Deltaproteobacteria bacterium RBG_16_44_11]|nr:MAG: hypothetical protein A2W27_11785 [Deltaproteobacteria bacterium RBG_16_44_11]
MKKSNFIVMFLIALFLVAGAAIVQAADKMDLTGKWNLSVTTPSGPGAPVFTLKQDGNKLTGTYKGYFGEAPVTGTVKGNSFEMKYTMTGVTTVYKGKVDGKKMSGNIDFGGKGTGTFTGNKE